MKSHVLNVESVEQLHRAALKAKPVDAVVANLTSATLSGLVEYACVREVHPNLPDLPSFIDQSLVGQAFRELGSPFELPIRRNQQRASQQITAQPCEFIVLRGDDDLEEKR